MSLLSKITNKIIGKGERGPRAFYLIFKNMIFFVYYTEQNIQEISCYYTFVLSFFIDTEIRAINNHMKTWVSESTETKLFISHHHKERRVFNSTIHLTCWKVFAMLMTLYALFVRWRPGSHMLNIKKKLVLFYLRSKSDLRRKLGIRARKTIQIQEQNKTKQKISV